MNKERKMIGKTQYYYLLLNIIIIIVKIVFVICIVFVKWPPEYCL